MTRVNYPLPDGRQTYEVPLRIPLGGESKCLLKAAAYAAGHPEPTLSRRKVLLANYGN